MAIVADVSDLHCNHPAGLLPIEGVETQSGNVLMPNLVQQWSWDRWLAFRDAVGEALARHGGPLHIIVNGEFVDGFHHGSTEFLSSSKVVMRAIARSTMQPLLDLEPATVHALSGTEAHSGKEGEDDEEVAASIGAVRDPRTGAATFYHLRAEFDGVRFDVKHHGPGAGQPWTAGGNALRLAARLVYDYWSDPPEERPHLALRAHVHRFADSGNQHPIRVIYSDAWQVNSVFGHKVDGGSAMRPVGGLIVHCDGNSTRRPYEVERHYWLAPRAPMLRYAGGAPCSI